MSIKRFAPVVVAAAMMSLPGLAAAEKPDTAGKGKGNAYGKYCQGESKKHVKGEKGTAFSRCVKAMHKAVDDGDSPKKACKGMSKKHVKGEKGTAYSRCVVAAAQAKKDAEGDA